MEADSAEARQLLICGLSDNPKQFERPAFSALIEQCSRAKNGNDDGGLSYLTMPF